MMLAFIAPVNKIVKIPIKIATSKTTVAVRLEPTKNGQNKGVNWLSDWLW